MFAYLSCKKCWQLQSHSYYTCNHTILAIAFPLSFFAFPLYFILTCRCTYWNGCSRRSWFKNATVLFVWWHCQHSLKDGIHWDGKWGYLTTDSELEVTGWYYKLLSNNTMYIKHQRLHLTTFPNTKKRVENTTCSGVFLMNFDVIESWSNTLLSIWCVSPQSKPKLRRKQRNKIVKIHAN